MYIADSKITIDIVIFVEIKTSNSRGGKGVIIANTMPRTAIGTLISLQFNVRKVVCHDFCAGTVLIAFAAMKPLLPIQYSVDLSQNFSYRPV